MDECIGEKMKKIFLFITAFLIISSSVVQAQIVESRRVAANALWETYGRNNSNPSQMPNAVPANPGNNIDQIVVAPNYSDLKKGLTDLLNNNGGVLRFSNTGPATINFNEVIELFPEYRNRDKIRTIVIQGADITFNGTNKSSIFLLRGSVRLIVQDAIFRNANFQGKSMDNLKKIYRTGGGAIEVTQSGPYFSSLRVRNCQFLDNTVSHFKGMGENQNGAAIRFNYGTSGEVFGSVFKNNKAVTGGAIGATSIQKLTIINSEFDSNLSNGYSSTVGYMNVVEGAGALRVDRTVKPLEIYGSKFTRNSANVKVSGIEVFAAPVSGFSPGMPSNNEPTLIIDNSEFSNNKYNNYAGVSNFNRAFFAGVIVFHGNSATIKMTNSVFYNNDVGQANIRVINNFEFSNCIFANTNFLDTSESIQQGAVFLQNIPESGSFDNCTFYKNEPRNGAVASDIMFWAGNIPSRVELNNSIFYRENTSTKTKQVKAPLIGGGNNQYIPTVNMSSVAEVSTSASDKSNPSIQPNEITDMCLRDDSLLSNIGGLPSCQGVTPMPPSITITSPANDASFTEGSKITVNVNASDESGLDHTSMYVDGGWVQTDKTPPYVFTAENLSVGTHEIKVHAQDNTNVWNSHTINVTINPEGVSNSGGTFACDNNDNNSAQCKSVTGASNAWCNVWNQFKPKYVCFCGGSGPCKK